MSKLPITHMTLYKHGVGFFERRARLDGEEVEISFRVEEMNDILKSLTVIDWGEGQVLGIDYATPQSREERLAGCSIRLGDDRSLRDLLVGLRGRRVRLLLDQGEQAGGVLLGLDELPDEQPLKTALVSLLADETAQVQAFNLGRLQGVEILDERGESDLRFFLQTSLSQENYRQVTIRLSPGEHELSVSYIAPAPTWRVSYRLVADPKAEGGPDALLLGWGIFDNRLEEDLKEISLSLVAGMPISFIYDLYTPFIPKRPVVEEEARVAAAPVDFAAQMRDAEGMTLGAGMAMMAEAAPEAMPPAPAGRARKAMDRDKLVQSAAVSTTGEALGELFQYVIGTPVTVGRGQSAMVPIISAKLDYRKDLLYNGAKLPTHPVATLRMQNESGLTLERGPVTVLEAGEYVGEAVLPFTVVGDELNVPYAVELGVKVQEQSNSWREIHRLSIRGAYLHVEEWETRAREYQVNNSTAGAVTVLLEHPRTSYYELYESPEPQEQTDQHFRFEIEAPARGEALLKVQERRLLSRQEELQRQSYEGLRRYLQRGLIDQAVYDKIAELLALWGKIAENERLLAEADKERQKIYKSQEQMRQNMAVLSETGKEGALRARYVEQLGGSEEFLKKIARGEEELQAEIERLKQEIEAKIKALG
ncbi:MAG: hypothetical protein JXA37_09715 [Chloroflexia bacterium]|nr:hypothetical protein [Chloroflexia bacterium]